MFGHTQKKPTLQAWHIMLLALLFGVGVSGFLFYRWVRSLSLETILSNPHVEQVVTAEGGEVGQRLFALLPSLLGVSSPKTYLVLFLNNTELRPGGGFIGAYALVTIDKGSFRIIKTEGSEILDKAAPPTWKLVPPAPLHTFLGVNQWFFRDSNWSPDFSESTKQTLASYRGEGGEQASDIDGVIALTPTAIERLLAIIGPVTLDGVTYTPQNITEKIEYDVEYGFQQKDISVANRKSLLGSLGAVVAKKVEETLPLHFKDFIALADELARQKQVFMYQEDPLEQKKIVSAGLDGSVVHTSGDYLLWVDANLGALKTDHALDRSLSYRIEKDKDGYIAHATMTYRHSGESDWRTTRYISYTRVFVPSGSTFLGLSGTIVDKKRVGAVDQGSDLGKQWFGTSLRVERGETATLTFSYRLPQTIEDGIAQKAYSLTVQKELGTISHALTLDLDFGTTVGSAVPAESPKEWGDGRYRVVTDLKEDRTFQVGF